MSCTMVIERFARVAFLIVVFMMLSKSGFSAPLDPVYENKTSPKILEDSRAGKPQNLFILIDARALDDNIAAKRKERGLNFNTPDLTQEKSQGYDQIKKEVLPSLQESGVKIIEDYSHLPTIMVHVPDIEALERILKHPKVRRVYADQFFKPATRETFL